MALGQILSPAQSPAPAKAAAPAVAQAPTQKFDFQRDGGVLGLMGHIVTEATPTTALNIGSAVIGGGKDSSNNLGNEPTRTLGGDTPGATAQMAALLGASAGMFADAVRGLSLGGMAAANDRVTVVPLGQIADHNQQLQASAADINMSTVGVKARTQSQGMVMA